ncbi:MAG: hypothetical protein Q9198_011123, partial [Flavoplaca austrocitrina]
MTINGNSTRLANYDARNQQWTALDGPESAVPGPVTSLTRANKDMSNFWIAGKSSNGSAYLMKYADSRFQSIGDGGRLGDQTTIQGLAMLGLDDAHDKSDLVGEMMVLLITGSLDVPNFGNASAALYDGKNFIPFVLSTSGNGPGSLSQLFSEKEVNFDSS